MANQAVVCGYARSPFQPAHRGAFARVRADDLLARVTRGLIDKSGVEAEQIEDIIIGCAFPEAEQGFNIARYQVFLNDFPVRVSGVTVNRWCASSMTAVHKAVGMIAAGAGDLFICGGIEHMTRIPMGGYNAMPNPALLERWPETYMSMGVTAENLAEMYQIERSAQETYAVHSHKKAAAAQEAGKLKDEIVPIELPDGSTVDSDGTIRADSNTEKMATLKPAFKADGTVHAGTSSPLTDGATAVMIASEDYAKANGLKIYARIKTMATEGCKPEIMGIGPVGAAKKAMARAGLTMADMDVIELHEAFAPQAMAVAKELDVDMEKTNLDGGTLAIGHPLGASGARYIGKIATLLEREDKELGIAFVCVGGGMGAATILERA